jgi:hypothetical protein
MSILDQLHKELDLLDNETLEYFQSTSLQRFLKTYVPVDRIIQTSSDQPPSQNTLLEQLEIIKSTLAQQLTTSQDFNNQLTTSLSNALRDITHNDIKNMLLEHQTNVQNLLKSDNNDSNISQLLQNFQDKLLNINTEKLNDFDRKSLAILSSIQSNILKDISTTLDSHTIHHKITSINDTVTTLHNNFTGNSSQKGKMSENMLFHNILKAFPDSDVVLTRDQKESCDIQIKREGRPTILIDSKHCEFSNVRKTDLDKFYGDCKLNNSSGILCNAFGGIANRNHFEIDIQDNNVFVFISNHEFDPVTFQLAARVIYNVYDCIKDHQNDVIQIDPQLYQRLKIEYNFFLQSFQQHIDNIRSNVNSLSQLAFCQLDQFFKRSNFNTTLKPFSCHFCGTSTSSSKALIRHLRDKHQVITPNAKRGRKPKTDESGED